MSDPAFDIVVCGSTPLALLLAGLLASSHGRRVGLVAESWSPYRLPRAFDMSVRASARPETWLLLQRLRGETLKLVNGIGKGLVQRIDPLFVAERPAAIHYLGHMRWLARASGFSAERTIERHYATAAETCRLRDAALLVPGRIEPALEGWVDKCGVTRLPSSSSIVADKETGHIVRAGSAEHEAAMVVLADDDAIFTHLVASADRHRLLRTVPRISVQTASLNRPLPATLVTWLDRDLATWQAKGKAQITAVADGEADMALPRVGASLPQGQRLHRTGQARFRALLTADGAPLVARIGRGRFTVVAGFGATGAFFAPLLARWFADTASEDERRYILAHDAGKGRGAVADLPQDAEAA